jgi:ATP-dependent 26S proteasome regulatory subunit
MLREELQLLQEQGSYVGEVVKPMDKKKVLVKVSWYNVLLGLVHISISGIPLPPDNKCLLCSLA